MVTIRKLFAAALLFCATAASADQYAIETSAPADAGTAGLQQALHITRIDAFETVGHFFVIVEAPNEAYVETYIRAMRYRPVALYSLEAAWNGAGLSSLPVEARSPFMLPTSCESCSS